MKRTFKSRFAGTIIILVMIAVFSAIVMLLWNVLMPNLFNFPLLNYWQAVGILLLAKILFGGAGGALSHRGIQRAETHFKGHVNNLREKWMNMSEEERKEFIAKERDFKGFHHRHGRRLFDDDDEDNEEKKDNDNE